MHIPDGYLSPATCATLGAAMVPVWVTAGKRVRTVVKTRSVPLVALGAAFSFVVMMFNLPVPNGTTAHGVGATLVAVLLGPWAAVIAVTTALVIQALFFGDGGVLALGANCFNMAFVMPFVGYGVYRLLAPRVALTSRWRAVAAGIGAYVGINVGALCAAVEFGLQPTLFSSPDGTPLYAPFHLAQTIPAMAAAHLTVAGLVELALTAGVVSYLQRANLPVLRLNHSRLPLAAGEDGAEVPPPAAGRRPPGWRWAVYGLIGLVLLTPLGLLAPGGAFGEDTPAGLDLGKYGLQAVPTGLARWSSFWDRAVLGGYGFHAGQHEALGYLLSALVGVAAIGVVVGGAYGLVRLVSRPRRSRRPAAEPVRT